MKSIVLLCLVAAAAAAPAVNPGDAGAEVVKYENENIGTGPFRYLVEQSNGIKSQATGDFHPGTGKDNEGGYESITGSFEWVGPDGVTYNAQYVADENGYRVAYTQGQGGVIPDEVVKNLPSPK